MKLLTNIEQFDKALEVNPLLLVYFSGANCSVCKSLKPKIEFLIEQQFPTVKFVEVKTEEAAELSAKYRVFTIPVVMFFVEGREYIREARVISTLDLSQKLEKIIKLYED